MRKHLSAILILLFATVAHAQTSVVGSPHDLSVSGPGRIHALDEEQVCIFCHTPHNATGQAPLWNRHTPPSHYRIYTSPTTDARIDQPSGKSKLCLSCHDGALALGLIASRPPNDPVVMSFRTIPPGESDLTQDLGDDHPIGFRFDRALYNRDQNLRNPDLLTENMPLGPHEEVQCTTCHDAHDNSLGDFLRVTTRRSAICLSCHDFDGWPSSSHALSGKSVTRRAVDLTEPLPYHTVADNACENCHKIHSARGRTWLLRQFREEDNCLSCHSGGVAANNIGSEIHKPSAHRVQRWTGRHSPNENPRSAAPHVECTDCHNPHAVNEQLVRLTGRPGLGQVSDATRLVSGVNRNGVPVARSRFEYEICFKCHADNVAAFAIQPVVTRQITQTNTRREFDPSNPSFHPVVAPRNNPDVVSLLAPWRVGSIIRCTDCHNSDAAGTNSPFATRGPHGSIYDPILIDNYDTDDFTAESPRAYALCYQCHDRASILGDQSFSLHNRHIVGQRTPCSACHDSHGVSRTQGNSRNNSSLINFDLSIVRPASGALGSRITYEDTGQFSGNCTLVCHGVTHVLFGYSR